MFYGFCKYFSSLGITTTWRNPSLWKYRIYHFFDNLGRMLGYDVITEDTFRKSDGIKELVGKRIDMTWLTPENDYFLALEYENTRKIDNDIDKLVAMSGLRVLVMFRFDFTDKQIIKKIQTKSKKFDVGDSEFFVIILPHIFEVKEPFQKLRALLFNSKAEVYGYGGAEGYVGINGVCAFRNVTWKELKKS